MIIGTCKLCLRDKMELQRSHFLPAGSYRILRDEGFKKPDPFLLTKNGVRQSSRQMWAYLLCWDCEQRLQRNGESWMFKNCLQKDGRFPLDTLLKARRPDVDSPETQIFYAAGIPEVNVSALAYFAASIFWRGSIYEWNDDRTIPVRLGPFGESFRRYLMGVEEFPTHSAMMVTLQLGHSTYNKMMYAPIGERREKFHVYKFPIAGIGFALAVGKNIPGNFTRSCFVHSPGNPLIVSDFLDGWLEKDAVKMITNSPRLLQAFRRTREAN